MIFERFYCGCGGLRSYTFARRESRSRTADAGCTEPSGAGVSVRLSAGDHGCYADGFHKHPHSYKQQGPHQPVHPCGKAGRCNDPCGGYAECGYHLYAGVSGCRRRTNDLRRAADRPLFNVQVLDAWTNTAAVLETPGLYAITRADWQGELPEGVQRIDVPTTMVWTIARIVLSGQEDLPNVRAIQDKMQLMPLSAYQAGGWTAPAGSYDPANDFVPVKHVLAMDAKEFFDTANQLMETNPPAAADAPVLRELAALHIGPGEKFDDKALGLFSGLRWKLMLLQLKKKLLSESKGYTRQMGQWTYFGDPIGNFGTAYTYRAMVALRGLGANTTDVAIYPKTDVDSTGTVLTGKKTYTLHIEADPPTLEKGFWSVTAYGENDFLIENPIDRYCVNDRSGLHRNPDGSIDITLSKEAPADTTNWLPVGEGDFHLFLRIYKPDAAALTDWQPPVVRTN